MSKRSQVLSKAKSVPSDGSRSALPEKPLTPAEQRAMEAWSARRKQEAPRIKFEGIEDGKGLIGIKPDGTAACLMLMEAIGARDEPFMAGILSQLVNASMKGREMDENAEAQANVLLSTVKGMEPRDHVESMLIAQMAVIHSKMMKVAWHVNSADNLVKFEAYEKALNRLSRTYVAQMEALKRYRTGGEQKVVVQHVHVNDGGQAAVVGNVNQNRGGRGERESRD